MNANASSIYITNYGKMGGASTSGSITIANYGEINLLNGNGKKYHFKDVKSLTLQNYALMISENTTTFNAFDGNNTNDNSHLILDSIKGVKFADANSKIILDFGGNFDFGAGYSLAKLVVDTSGTNKLQVDLSCLIPRSDIYHITQQGDKFIVHLSPQHSTIGNLYKSNIRMMNNFYTMSNAMIYPHKYSAKRTTKKKRVIRRVKKISSLRENERSEFSWQFVEFVSEANQPSTNLESIKSLESHESFAYRNEAQNRIIKRQNKRNYNHKESNNPIILSNSEETQKTLHNPQSRDSSPKAQNDNGRKSHNLTQNTHDYYFILTPFINHNLFFESGRYNLSGFDYGFLTAFSGKLTESNALGAHFIMSYGSLSDSKDKDFMIKSLNLNLGINYKLDLIWDMFVKARGDFYYFLNQAKTLTMIEAIKPNNMGFGLSVSYGKDFDFKQGGVLGIEVGLDYKALQSSTISLHDNVYQKALYHLLYADLGVSYSKYFGNFGLNAGLGIKGNITANKLAKSQIRISALDRSVDMVLDNDMFLGYANIGASYVLNKRDFDMEFSLAYYGNFGDRVISNGGGVEWRVFW